MTFLKVVLAVHRYYYGICIVPPVHVVPVSTMPLTSSSFTSCRSLPAASCRSLVLPPLSLPAAHFLGTGSIGTVVLVPVLEYWYWYYQYLISVLVVPIFLNLRSNSLADKYTKTSDECPWRGPKYISGGMRQSAPVVSDE